MTPERIENKSSEPIVLTESSLARVLDEFLPEEALLPPPAARNLPGAADNVDELFAEERMTLAPSVEPAAIVPPAGQTAMAILAEELAESGRPWRNPDFSELPGYPGTVQATRGESGGRRAALIASWVAAGFAVAVAIAAVSLRSSDGTPATVLAELPASDPGAASPAATSASADTVIADSRAASDRAADALSRDLPAEVPTAARPAESLGPVLKGSLTPDPPPSARVESPRVPVTSAVSTPSSPPMAPAPPAPAPAAPARPVPLPPAETATAPAPAAPAPAAEVTVPPATEPVPAPRTTAPSASLDAGPVVPLGSSTSVPSPSPSPPAITAPSDVADIERVLGHYRLAFSALDAGAASAVWPSVDARALGRAFDQLAQQQLEFETCRITVSGGRATAACGGRARYVPKVGSKSMRDERRQWTFDLSKVDDAWRIERVASR